MVVSIKIAFCLVGCDAMYVGTNVSEERKSTLEDACSM
jgi:hypothetical protein